MKIGNVKNPPKERVLEFLEEHPDEVYSLKELKEVFTDMGYGSLKHAVYSLHTNGKIDRFVVHTQKHLYGCHEAIEKLNRRFKNEDKQS